MFTFSCYLYLNKAFDVTCIFIRNPTSRAPIRFFTQTQAKLLVLLKIEHGIKRALSDMVQTELETADKPKER